MSSSWRIGISWATRRFFTRALDHGTYPAEVSTDRAPAYPRVLDELLLPSTCHVTEQYANNAVGSRSRPTEVPAAADARVSNGYAQRGMISTEHAFIQNLHRGHYELAIDFDPNHRLPAASPNSCSPSNAGTAVASVVHFPLMQHRALEIPDILWPEWYEYRPRTLDTATYYATVEK
jgi:hypothetical protein